jgi:HEAT repeat protein
MSTEENKAVIRRIIEEAFNKGNLAVAGVFFRFGIAEVLYKGGAKMGKPNIEKMKAEGDVEGLIKTLKDKNEDARWDAARALGQMGPDARAVVPNLVKALRDRAYGVRSEAAWALGQIGDKTAVPALIDALRCPPQPREPLMGFDWRHSAAEALGKIGDDAATPALSEALKDEVREVRDAAIEALEKIGTRGKDSVPPLIEALKSTQPLARLDAAEALGDIGVDAKSGVPALIKALEDEHNGVRWAAAIALGEIGSEAKAAVSALVKALGDEALEVRMRAAQALGKIGGKAAVHPLTRLLKYDELAAIHAHSALAKITGKPQDHVPILIDLLKNKSKDISVRWNAAEALAEIGPDAKAAVPALTEALEDEDLVQVYAHYALAKITGKTQEHVAPALAKLTELGLSRVTNKAAKVLKKLQSKQ